MVDSAISWIDTKIVYEPGNLALAYNRAMENTNAEWVLFLDQDLFICNPNWYVMSLNAVREVGSDAGWITARCNRIVNRTQLYKLEHDPDDVLYHIEIANRLYKEHRNEVVEVPSGKFGGFFILTSKTVWKKVGGFINQGTGISGIDIDYCARVRAKGFKTYVMPGLYFYHLYKHKWGSVFAPKRWK